MVFFFLCLWYFLNKDCLIIIFDKLAIQLFYFKFFRKILLNGLTSLINIFWHRVMVFEATFIKWWQIWSQKFLDSQVGCNNKLKLLKLIWMISPILALSFLTFIHLWSKSYMRLTILYGVFFQYGRIYIIFTQ